MVEENCSLEITLTPALSLKKGEGVISVGEVGLFDLPNGEMPTHIYYGDHTHPTGRGESPDPPNGEIWGISSPWVGRPKATREMYSFSSLGDDFPISFLPLKEKDKGGGEKEVKQK